jgi:membrane protease YdiL (CAAX protease family)
VAILLAVLAARIPAFREYYAGKGGPAYGRVALIMINIFAVEFMFRGFILFGLKERLGGGAVLVQMVPFALLHLHKPGLEAAGCVISGIYFGYLAWRTDSLWPVYIIHCVAALSMIVFAA